jgi:hypothetical protein
VINTEPLGSAASNSMSGAEVGPAEGRETEIPIDLARLTEGLDAVIGPVVSVPVADLHDPVGVRYPEEDDRYCRLLASLESPLAPILVHRQSMAIIDGMHRLFAARRRDRHAILARFIDASTEDAFVVAVRSNTAFGKPLSLAERERAAERILATHPQWSDRIIAQSCGLSGKTVGVIRRRSTAHSHQLNSRRLGRDGKMRPLDTHEARQKAAQILTGPAPASLRAVARRTGLSPATVSDVRDRLQRGEPPHPPASGRTEPPRSSEATSPRPDGSTLLSDPALRSMEGGEAFTAWLASRRIRTSEWKTFVDRIPTSRIYDVAAEARACAEAWKGFADVLESRAGQRRRPLAEPPSS